MHSVLVSVFLVRHTYAVLVVAALLHAQPFVFQVLLQHRSEVFAPPHPHLHPSILQQIAPKPLRVVPHPTLGLPLHHRAVEPQVHRPHAPAPRHNVHRHAPLPQKRYLRTRQHCVLPVHHAQHGVHLHQPWVRLRQINAHAPIQPHPLHTVRRPEVGQLETHALPILAPVAVRVGPRHIDVAQPPPVQLMLRFFELGRVPLLLLPVADSVQQLRAHVDAAIESAPLPTEPVQCVVALIHERPHVNPHRSLPLAHHLPILVFEPIRRAQRVYLAHTLGVGGEQMVLAPFAQLARHCFQLRLRQLHGRLPAHNVVHGVDVVEAGVDELKLF